MLADFQPIPEILKEIDLIVEIQLVSEILKDCLLVEIQFFPPKLTHGRVVSAQMNC